MSAASKKRRVSNGEESSSTLEEIKLQKEEIQKAWAELSSAYRNIGEHYYKLENYSTAMEWYLKAAKHDNSAAQNDLGWMYQYGEGVRKDYKQAMEWYLKAANNDGSSAAQCNIGYLYKNGSGVPIDIHTAVEWFTKSAIQKELNSLRQLAFLYEYEDEVKDLQKAADYYKRVIDCAAESGVDNSDNDYEVSEAETGLKRLEKKGYFPKEKSNAKEKTNEIQKSRTVVDLTKPVESTQSSKHTSNPQLKQLDPTTQSDQHINNLIEEKVKKIETSFQFKLDQLQQEQEIFGLKMEVKDKEIKLLKDALARYKSD